MMPTGARTALGGLFRAACEEISEKTPGEPIGRADAVWGAVERVALAIEGSSPAERREHLQMKWSVGKGRYTEVPWIALLDVRVTNDTKRGVYVVYLFNEDGSGVYLTLIQGVTAVLERHKPQTAGYGVLTGRSDAIGVCLGGVKNIGFQTQHEMALKGAKKAPSYTHGTIAQTYYPADAIPGDKQLLEDLEAMLQLYERYAERFEGVASSSEHEQSESLLNIDAPPAQAALEAVAPRIDLAATVQAFSNSLRSAGLSFGVQHDAFVRAFITSLATKNFVILTGLSGSGKTQIAQKFGQWLGEAQMALIPVRPDWTGAEALFGYEDALAKVSDDGRRGWAVPRALEFMLRAARNPAHPYLLLLDEMNLAHVERYFADVLSGMESGERVLPNLSRESDGVWRLQPGAEPWVAVPSNLFIVGTVNVDETTYMFSPKVLDRANTLEFRVPTEALAWTTRKPQACELGPRDLVRGLLAISADPNGHLENEPTWLGDYVDELKRVHELLSEGGFEFGHRVFFEAIRFASLLEQAGEESWTVALDRQILQKLLPRLHGSRRRLESTLCALGRYCWTQDVEPGAIFDGRALSFDPISHNPNEAALPLSADKIRRMTRSLRANQFASFTE
ncbi:DUF3578 domain-containing protein [Lujinxingia sediminis]|uniref:DUF3578 domain-containing protein n=1 Tax=Lujinxingia sediminis TaxID=2480984 RepID=A0ABY0CXH8_9DELT|nr:DUF3578 domain-containing protein [Lujinxingia sediminis]RVU48319.1 DUF3578 domain-containing protein [Lujinxingia sediminis]